MRILFFISVHRHGRGGHFHSLNHISRQIGEHNEVKIISFGPGRSEAITSNPYFESHIDFNGYNLLSLKKEIDRITKTFNPEIYHFFDDGSYNVISLFVSSKKCKVFINKCGGPNPKRYPNVPNLILFSTENYEWFKERKKYVDSSLSLIPNRVKALSPMSDFRPIVKRSDEFVFMRICRIGSVYKKSILDSIALIEKLSFANVKNVKLYIVGVVQDENLFNILQMHPLVKAEQIIFLTESFYTRVASNMLYLADAVIGTGRGLMEAASLSIPLLAVNKEGNHPVLLNKLNFHDAFKTNFSERNIFNDQREDENINNIVQLVQDKMFCKEAGWFSKEVFHKYFDLNNVDRAYSDAYASAVYGRNKAYFDFCLIAISIVGFYKSYRSKKELVRSN